MTIEPMGNSIPIQTQTSTPVRKADVKPVETNIEPVSNNYKSAEKTTIIVSDSNGSNNRELSEQEQQQTNKRIRKAVETMNKTMGNTEALFGIHEGTNRVTIKIIDRETKEVIKELPPEKTLDMIEKVWEMAGILVDERR